jgi:hypothetical protein
VKAARTAPVLERSNECLARPVPTSEMSAETRSFNQSDASPPETAIFRQELRSAKALPDDNTSESLDLIATEDTRAILEREGLNFGNRPIIPRVEAFEIDRERVRYG